MIRKLFIVAWFGPLPEWMSAYGRNIETLDRDGYDWLFLHDLGAFRARVRDRLGVSCPIVAGGSKIHDYRAAFGVLFADEIAGYDFWGHTDLDCVYGRASSFVTDEFLGSLDVHSDHWSYLCGPWALYRNTATVNEAFMAHPDWQGYLEEPETSGWVETEYTRIVKGILGDRMVNTLWQHRNFDDFAAAHWENGRLMEGPDERLLAHFRRTKIYPAALQ